MRIKERIKDCNNTIFFLCTYYSIPVGKNNRYGHPNKETLDNLVNSKIYRTDLDKVTIGTSIDRSQDAILPIPKRRVKTLSPNNNDIFLVLEDVNGIIEKFLILNNNNKKSR